MTITIDTPDFHIADVMRFYRGAESNMFYQESGNHQEPGKSRPGKFVAHVGTNGLTMYRTRMVVCWCVEHGVSASFFHEMQNKMRSASNEIRPLGARCGFEVLSRDRVKSGKELVQQLFERVFSGPSSRHHGVKIDR